MTSVRFDRATREHAEVLAKDMRAEDIREVNAAGQTPRQALTESLERSSVAFTAKFDGNIAFMFGAAPVGYPATTLGTPEVGWAWLLTGNQCNRSPKAFLKHRERCLQALLEVFPVLIGFVDSEYRGALRLVQRMGFKLGEAKEFVPGERPFVSISIRRDSWAQ